MSSVIRLSEFRRAHQGLSHPDNAASLHEAGRQFVEQESFDEAIDCFERTLEIAPESLATLANLAAALQATGKFESAREQYLRALQLAPDHPAVYNDLAAAEEQLGLVSEALHHYTRAIELDPNFAVARANRAIYHLKLGRLQQGWSEYDWRFRAPNGSDPSDPLDIPRFAGESLAGRRLLVHGEQGIGDEVLFASMLTDVSHHAAACTTTCDRRLLPLFERSIPEIRWLPYDELRTTAKTAASPTADVQISAGSLAQYCRADWNDFPRPQTYLRADPAAVAQCRQWLATLGSGLKVGIAWQGGTTAKERNLRTIPIRPLNQLLAVPDVQWIRLQHDTERPQFPRLARSTGETNLHNPEVDPVADIDEYAALLSALDLVISVSNSTVHLAGALGTPTWVLLPPHYGWQWFSGRSDSVWYPHVRLYRQSALGDWDGLIRNMTQTLAAERSSYQLHRAA